MRPSRRVPPSTLGRRACVATTRRIMRKHTKPHESMKLRTLLLLGMSSAMLAACGWFHAGPGARDIDAAVRRALDAENRGPFNTMLGQPLPVAADVASVTPIGDCAKVAERAYSCNVAIAWRNGQPSDGDATLRATLTFTEDSDGAWQTSPRRRRSEPAVRARCSPAAPVAASNDFMRLSRRTRSGAWREARPGCEPERSASIGVDAFCRRRPWRQARRDGRERVDWRQAGRSGEDGGGAHEGAAIARGARRGAKKFGQGGLGARDGATKTRPQVASLPAATRRARVTRRQ